MSIATDALVQELKARVEKLESQVLALSKLNEPPAPAKNTDAKRSKFA